MECHIHSEGVKSEKRFFAGQSRLRNFDNNRRISR